MNLKCFTGRTSREAMASVRHAFGVDAIILSTKPAAGGVEILAMSPDTAEALERVTPGATQRMIAVLDGTAQSAPAEDAERLAMSTLSFQDYVRERMARRRAAEAGQKQSRTASPAATPRTPATAAAPAAAPVVTRQVTREQEAVMQELGAMKKLLQQHMETFAFASRLQRSSANAQLAQKLLGCGFSTGLIRKLMAGMPPEVSDPLEWAARILACNVQTNEQQPRLEEAGGTYALIGAPGVGKTTSVAKLAAACARRHGAQSVGLITLDGHRLGAHEQLRAHGRTLGIAVHLAHDATALHDLRVLLANRKLIVIDTVALSQTGQEAPALPELLADASIEKLLVLDAAAQSESMNKLMRAYRASNCSGVVLSKVDEAAKLGPALDNLIRHGAPVMAVADGQRVPEDWRRVSSATLVERALRYESDAVYRMDGEDANLVFAASNGIQLA